VVAAVEAPAAGGEVSAGAGALAVADVPVSPDDESPPQAVRVRVVRAAATSDNTPPRRRMVLGMH
jgi:hypothetical protein